MIHVDGKEFNRALRLLSEVIPRKMVLPSLERVLFTAKDDVLTLTATDLDIFVTITLPCKGTGEGTFYLKDVIKMVKGAKQIGLGENLTADGMVMQIHGVDILEYPAVPMISNYTQTEAIPHFFTGLSKALPFVGTDITRPVFTGVWLDGSNVIACDTHRLYLYDIGIPLPTCIIPGKSAKIFGAAFKSYRACEAVLSVSASDVRARLTIGNVTVITRLIEGQIPDYMAWVRKFSKPKTVAKVDIKLMQNAISRFVAEKVDHIRMHVNGAIRIAANGTDLTVPAEAKGKSLEIFFNPKYVKDVLNIFRDQNPVTLEFFEELEPLMIRGDRELSLTLPINLK